MINYNRPGKDRSTSVATLPPAQYSVTIHIVWSTGKASITWLMLRALFSLRIFSALTSLRNSLYESAVRGLAVSLSSMSRIFTATTFAVLKFFLSHAEGISNACTRWLVMAGGHLPLVHTAKATFADQLHQNILGRILAGPLGRLNDAYLSLAGILNGSGFDRVDLT